MKVAAISDMHGRLPKPDEMPKANILLIAGDICPVECHDVWYQQEWLDTIFRKWLEALPYDSVVGIAGNHDVVFFSNLSMVPELPWSYLQDEWLRMFGLTIYGMPWTQYYVTKSGSADKTSSVFKFHVSAEDMQHVCGLIEKDTSVLISHGPPFGYGDYVLADKMRVGSYALTSRLNELPKLKLVVFGHIHDDPGIWSLGNATLANVSRCDALYQPVHPIPTFDL